MITPKPLHAIKSPVTGKQIEWKSSAHTDIRATFERIRAEMSDSTPARKNIRKIK
jgi:hypothetical protein